MTTRDMITRLWMSAVVAVTAVSMTCCNSIEDYDNNNLGNFDALWTFVDQHYCFFDQKDIDWDSIGERYREEAARCASQRALFNVMARMLDELRDGHVNLSSWFDTSYYRKWWSEYPQNYDARIVEQNYLAFDYHNLGSTYYGILMPANIGYLRIPTFASGLGESNIDAILSYFRLCSGLIIDVRDNGGGDLTNVEPYVRRFITEPIVAGYMVHKNGTGHDDFAKPYQYTYTPAPRPRQLWTKPVAVLVNRSTFSAANNFAGIMKTLPQVILVGATTGGGSGMPMSSELPNGWGVRISACRILDPAARDTEFGVEPTGGYAVDMTPEQIAAGRDVIIDTAIEALSK